MVNYIWETTLGYIKVSQFLDHVSWPSFVENFYFFGYIAQMHMASNSDGMEGIWGAHSSFQPLCSSLSAGPTGSI